MSSFDDDDGWSTDGCPLYPLIRYPCCSPNFLDGFGIPFLFVGEVFVCWGQGLPKGILTL